MHVVMAGALAAAPLALVGSSSAAPPPGPGYQCSSNDGPEEPNPIKIMIAGDSITNASAGDYTWPYWLWKDQDGRGANVDFVGRFQDTINANTREQGSRQYIDCDFDQDHEARPGVKLWTDPDNLPNGKFGFGSAANYQNNPVYPYYPGATSWIRGAVTAHTPDIIVLFAGGNDLARTSEEPELAGLNDQQIAAFVAGKLKGVIAQARLGNPDVDVVITTVPTTSATSRAGRYNALLPGVVSDLNTANARVVLATLPGWSNHTWDGVHPDAVGEVAIAAAIDDKLHAINPALFARPNPLPTPKIGPRMTAVLDPPALDGDNKVKLTWTLPFGSDRTVVYARNKSGNGPWVRKADLVLGSLRYYYPSVGTQACGTVYTLPQTPCTTYTVSGLSGGTEYEFMLASAKGLALSPDLRSAAVAATPTGPVGRIDAPAAVAGLHAVTVSWTNLGGVPGYDVQWRQGGTNVWKSTTSAGSSRVISSLVAGRAYAFRVKAQGTATWSTEVVAKPRANALAVGKKPVLTKVSGKKIRATWAASAGALKYQVQRRVKGGAWKVVATTTARTLVSKKLTKGKTYEFRIRPFDGDVGGAYSPTAKRKVS